MKTEERPGRGCKKWASQNITRNITGFLRGFLSTNSMIFGQASWLHPPMIVYPNDEPEGSVAASLCSQVGASFPSPIDTSALHSAASRSGPSSGVGADGRLMRVVLALRPGSPRRSIMNADKVMEWCNAWKPSDETGTPGSSAGRSGRAIRKYPAEGGTHGEGGVSWKARHGEGPFVGAECVSYDFEDLLLSAALMQQADVLIALHGEFMLQFPDPCALLPPD